LNRARILLACVLTPLLAATAACSGDDDDDASARTTSSSASSTTAGNDSTSVPSTGTGPGTTTPPNTGIASNLLPPIGVGEPGALANNLFATVTRIEPTTFTAAGPGETSGPGVLVTVEVRNETDEAIDLAGFAINAHYGDGTPAPPIMVAGDALAGLLAPGERKSGQYGFRVAQGQEATVVVDIQHSSAPNLVVVDASM